jgi:DNA-binding response OmpR family regulator
MAKILVVDDDPNIRELVRVHLKNNGFEVVLAVDGCDGMVKTVDPPDLAIIDLMMPKMDGFELCRQLRDDNANLPILMLTAKADIDSKAKGYGVGIDDYLTKPFDGAELIMRVKALLRRYKIESSQVITSGRVTIDRNSFTVNGEDIPRKEFELLFKLAGFPGRTFSRDSLIEDVWGGDFDGNERTLDVHIGRLRERYPTEKYDLKIATVRGLGYRLEVARGQ